MYELIPVSEHDHYIDCPAKIGLVRFPSPEGDASVAAIDSGIDKDTAKKVLRRVDEQGWRLTKVFNTHAHADHIGGNKHLQEKTGCEIFLPGMECDVANRPVWGPSALYGGFPYADLHHKLLIAPPCRASYLTPASLPEGFSAVDLRGHSPEMTGYITPDGTVFLGDVVISRETLAKYAVGFLWDVEAHLASLEKVKRLEGRVFVPSHAPATEDILPLVEVNIAAVHTVAERILSLCASPVSFDVLLAGLFDSFGLVMNAQQHTLIGSTLRSYLSWLYGRGEVTCAFDANVMLWERR